MIKGIQSMRCGACGCDEFKIYTTDAQSNIYIECKECESSSIVQPTEPKLSIGLCILKK